MSESVFFLEKESEPLQPCARWSPTITTGPLRTDLASPPPPPRNFIQQTNGFETRPAPASQRGAEREGPTVSCPPAPLLDVRQAEAHLPGSLLPESHGRGSATSAAAAWLALRVVYRLDRWSRHKTDGGSERGRERRGERERERRKRRERESM